MQKPGDNTNTIMSKHTHNSQGDDSWKMMCSANDPLHWNVRGPPHTESGLP